MDKVQRAADIVTVLDRRIIDLEKIIFKSTTDSRSNYFKQVNENVDFIDRQWQRETRKLKEQMNMQNEDTRVKMEDIDRLRKEIKSISNRYDESGLEIKDHN